MSGAAFDFAADWVPWMPWESISDGGLFEVQEGGAPGLLADIGGECRVNEVPVGLWEVGTGGADEVIRSSEALDDECGIGLFGDDTEESCEVEVLEGVEDVIGVFAEVADDVFGYFVELGADFDGIGSAKDICGEESEEAVAVIGVTEAVEEDSHFFEDICDEAAGADIADDIAVAGF